jgi:tetratricopeptide (TPR) repeat protein
MAIHRESGDERSLAYVAVNAIEPDDLGAARRDFEAALTLFRSRGDAWNTSRALRNLAVAALREGKLAEARERFLECLRLQRELGDRWLIARTLNHLGDIARSLGDVADAERCYLESRAEEKILESRAHAAWALAGLGRVALAEGRNEPAARHFDDGLHGGALGKPEHLAACLMGLAELRRQAGDLPRAALLLGAATPLVSDARRRMLAADLDAFERTASAVRAALGEAAFEAARSEAAGLGLAEVIARSREGWRPAEA